MNQNIVIRNYRKEDRKYLEDIIRRTWQYDRFSTPKTAKRLAHLYFLSCFANQTFVKVAERNGILVGVIMGKDCKNYKRTLSGGLRQMMGVIALCSSREGRQIANAFSGIEKVDQELLENRGKTYAGELVFFAVDENCRGLGIGKKLFEAVLSYMKGQGIPEFYLYTDSSCNYGFYEHQGMKRCGMKKYQVELYIENEMEFYLYEYII